VLVSSHMPGPREVVHRWLDPGVHETPFERATNAGLVALIILNVAAVILESVDAIHQRFARAFDAFEWFSVAVFTVEYVLRVWSATADPRYARPVTGRLRFMLTPGALVDLVAIVPAYLPIALDLRFARIVRLGRMMRILKIGRYSRPLRMFGRVFHARRDDLVLVGALLLVLLVVAASSMYFLENGAQPEAFSSIPASMWWAVSTLTTVGYGDVYPVTPLGKVVGSFLAMLGIGFFALPAGILAGAFARELRQQKAEGATACPHCGKAIAGALTAPEGPSS
jgi:voltage-gated potassium channel